MKQRELHYQKDRLIERNRQEVNIGIILDAK